MFEIHLICDGVVLVEMKSDFRLVVATVVREKRWDLYNSIWFIYWR